MAGKLADQFVKIVDQYPTKDFKNLWTKGMENYKKITGKQRPGDARFAFLNLGRKSTGISASLDAINDLQVAFVKKINAFKKSDAKRYEKKLLHGPDYVVRDDAEKHLKNLQPAIALCIKTITDYTNVSINGFAVEQGSVAREKKIATNNVKKAASKASQDLRDILKKVEARESSNKLLEDSFEKFLGKPLKDISNQLMGLLCDLESCLDKAWAAHFEADESSVSSRSSVSSKSSRFTTTTQDQPDDSESEDDRAKEFERQHKQQTIANRKSTKDSRKSTGSDF